MNKRKEALEQAHQHWNQGNFQVAYELYEDELGAAPNDPEILREYARAKYSEYDDLEYAAQLFERAVAAAPNSIPALLCLGELYSCGYGKGYEAALGIYQQVIELDSHNADAYLGIGMLEGTPSSSVALKDAIEAFRTAAQIAPHRADVHINLSTALIEDGDREHACKELEIAEKLLVQIGKHRLAQSLRTDRQKVEKNQRITSFAYGKTEPMVWDF